MKLFIILLTAGLWSVTAVEAQQAEYVKIESKHFKRLYQLSDELYRSEQPNKKGFSELESMGIKSVIDFRRKWKDPRRAGDTEIKLISLPLKASELDEEDLTEALKLIRDADKPVLIHCWHGSDRTGGVAAAYRMVFENWSAEKAIGELRTKGFGHHEKRFPGVVELLNGLDAQKIRSELAL